MPCTWVWPGVVLNSLQAVTNTCLWRTQFLRKKHNCHYYAFLCYFSTHCHFCFMYRAHNKVINLLFILYSKQNNILILFYTGGLISSRLFIDLSFFSPVSIAMQFHSAILIPPSVVPLGVLHHFWVLPRLHGDSTFYAWLLLCIHLTKVCLNYCTQAI